jgi:hypothetical protein
MMEYLTKVAAQRRVRRGRDQEKEARGGIIPPKNPHYPSSKRKGGRRGERKSCNFSGKGTFRQIRIWSRCKN